MPILMILMICVCVKRFGMSRRIVIWLMPNIISETYDSYSDFVRPQVPYEGIINSIPNYGETLSRTNVYSSGINAQAAEAAEQSPSVEKRTTPKIFDTEFDEDPAKDFHVN